jgi:serine phosphatase RsbU (regulator of sigma subunit)/HAMP domain-containing protein
MQKQKTTTVQKQLLINILLPVIVVICLFSVINYLLNQLKLKEYQEIQRTQIINEAKSLLSVYDEGLQIIEEELNNRITLISNKLVNEYFKQTNQIASADLYQISLQLGMDTSKEHIYIIDTNCIIINTTFKTDYLLDFKKINHEFVDFFNGIRKNKKLKIDRFGTETLTLKTKKYSFHPTLDGKYIVELGFYSEKAGQLEQNVKKRIEDIKRNYNEITDISIHTAIKEITDPRINKNHGKAFSSCIQNKSIERVVEKKGNTKQYYDYIYLEMPDAALYSGYVMLMKSDDSKEKRLLLNELIQFLVLLLFTVIPLSILIYVRSKAITRPIQKLTEKAQLISAGELHHKVEVYGHNEISSLSETFNIMVTKLRESYNTLEQKVIERTMQLKQQKELVEEKQKEIIDSINYAKRIQQAILPPLKLIRTHLPQSFVLYKPKDIVAGDFYWFYHIETDTHKTLHIAAADCTGHGVPGALVSVVCSTALNRAVKEFNINEPGKILDKTRQLVLETFEKSGADVKDGMDISLCSISTTINPPHKKEIKWAGANNPLWYWINNELKEIKPDKQPIGKSDHAKPFTTHILQPDIHTLFLFTDGYADQFGGEKGKKFKYKPFQDLLISIIELTPDEQQKILDEKIETWRGDLEQNDDICVIGIKL